MSDAKPISDEEISKISSALKAERMQATLAAFLQCAARIESDAQTISSQAEEIERLKQPWQPIETAPKDRTEVRLYTPNGEVLGAWEEHEDDAPDQPGHDAGWYGIGYNGDPVIWGRTKEAGFVGVNSYFYEAQNQPTHWQPITAPQGEE